MRTTLGRDVPTSGSHDWGYGRARMRSVLPAAIEPERVDRVLNSQEAGHSGAQLI